MSFEPANPIRFAAKQAERSPFKPAIDHVHQMLRDKAMQEQIELPERWSAQFRDGIRDEKSLACQELKRLLLRG